MKKQCKLFLTVMLCLLIALSCAMLCACQDDPQTATQITVTVNLNMDGVSNQSFTADVGEDGKADFYDKLASYLPQQTNGLTFAGWRDSSGAVISAQTRWDKDGIVIAQWNATYTVEYYLQTDDGYAVSNEHTQYKTTQVGSTVVADRITIEGYVFDADNALNVASATLSANTTLKMYYKRATVTITYVVNNPDAVGSMAQQTVPYGLSTQLAAIGFTWKNDDHSDFGYWNTQANGLGDSYADECTVTLTSDITLYAQWKISYDEEIRVEQFDGTDYVYVLFKTVTQDGLLGNSVSVQTTLREEDYETLGHNHYYLDETKNTPEAELSTMSLKDGDVLVAFYSIERHTLTYNEDNTVASLRYGEKYTVRAPEEDPNSDKVIVTYSSDINGNGREYPFGSEITIDKDITLYPLYADVYTDSEGSGDKVVIRSVIDGLGSVKLIKDGVGYSGYLNVQSDSLVTFDVTIDGNKVHGKLYSDGTFLYRLENEVGTYLLGDYLFPDDGVSPYVMLALDGYGIGVLSSPAADGSGRTENYYVSYAQTTNGDYYMEYYLPANPNNVSKGYFQIVHEQIEGAEELGLSNVVGYFLLRGYEYGKNMLVSNGAYNADYALDLDGYGNGALIRFSATEDQVQIDGTYLASENYTDEVPEYVFVPLDTAQDPFVFILFAQQNPNTGEYVYFFMIKQAEEGAYHPTADASYPELYLDGYGTAAYVDSESGDVRYGTYTIKDNDGSLEVTVRFADETGGTMRVIIDIQNNVYEPNTNDFEIENGVLIKYYGADSVIVVPEGVTEIDGNAFFDETTQTHLSITTVTLPSTLTKIGDYAFQNNSASGKSALKTVYLNAVTPPELGEDPFRWITSEFKIIVPDEATDAYRASAFWTAAQPSLNSSNTTYADYVTSLAEIANKPEFEIKNGVLISYNNKDEDPRDVAITIPDEVTEIAAHVFEGRAYITSVNLNNVTVIGESAFDGCVNLAQITFNPNTVSIGDYAFYNCLGLTEVNLGNVQTIGNAAFRLCYNLTKVTIGNAITSIGQQTFALCAVEVDADETITKQNELIVTISATMAPAMSSGIFQGSTPRIYVNSYETGVAFARSSDWEMYAAHLRVKADQTQTLYSLSNMGAELVLADNALFDESRSGLYKWDGAELHIAWFDRDEFTNNLTVLEQVGDFNVETGLIRGFSHYTNDPLVFVVSGTEVTYAKGDETLSVIFGYEDALYNGNEVTIDIVNYRMQFTYNGYVYHVSLSNDNTFTYVRNKVKTTVTYTAADGSQLTVTFGDSTVALGTIVTGDGSDVFPRTTKIGWYLTEEADGTYTWIIPYLNDKYKVTAVFNDDGTFAYTVGNEAVSVTYWDSQDYVIVTTNANGTVDMLFGFKTANGVLNGKCVNVQAVSGADNTYAVTIAIMIDVYDENDNKIGEVPSEFNGNYSITLNIENNTYVLTAIE